MKNLFKSSTLFDLLTFFVGEENREFYLFELSEKLKRDPGNLTRDLNRLSEEGVIKVHRDQDKNWYSFNADHPAAQAIRTLVTELGSAELDARFNRKWLLAEDIPNMDPFFSKIWLNSFVDKHKRPAGRSYERIAAVYRDYHLWFYYDEEDARDVGESIVQDFERDPALMDRVNEKIIELSDSLRTFANSVPEIGLDKLSNEQLWNIYKKHENIHTEYYIWGWIPVAADMFGNNLTEFGKRLLGSHGILDDRVNEFLVPLTQPTTSSLLKIEQDNLMQIGIKVQADQKQYALFQELYRKFKEEDVKKFELYHRSPDYEKKFEEVVRELIAHIRPDILKDLQDHYATYFYTKFLFTEEQGVYSFEHYLKELVRLVNGQTSLVEIMEKDRAEAAHVIEKRESIMNELGFDDDERRILNAWGTFMVTKIYRRFAQLFALYRMVPVIEEIGNRFGLTIKETKFMTTDEIEHGLLKGVCADRDAHEFLTGPKAERAANMVQKEMIEQTTELKGQCGCQGYAKGTVKIVNVIEEMEKVHDGDILVSISTQPDLVPAMKRAAAFVTEQGGVTSHAAIVAREMNKPCVIGTKIATKVLKDGMMVEVDATKGIVRVL
jgi:phosphohistidine swiveling domain-containing protein